MSRGTSRDRGTKEREDYFIQSAGSGDDSILTRRGTISVNRKLKRGWNHRRGKRERSGLLVGKSLYRNGRREREGGRRGTQDKSVKEVNRNLGSRAARGQARP